MGHLICPPFTQHATALMMILSSHNFGPIRLQLDHYKKQAAATRGRILLLKQIIFVRTFAIKLGSVIHQYKENSIKQCCKTAHIYSAEKSIFYKEA